MYFEDFQVGDSFPVLKKDPITRVQLVRFAGASGDFNPLHTVEEVGEQAGTGYYRSRNVNHEDVIPRSYIMEITKKH